MPAGAAAHELVERATADIELLGPFTTDRVITQEQANNIWPVLRRVVTVAEVLSQVGVAASGRVLAISQAQIDRTYTRLSTLAEALITIRLRFVVEPGPGA